MSASQHTTAKPSLLLPSFVCVITLSDRICSLIEYRLPVEPLEGRGYLAVCAQIEGCHAKGATIGEAIDNLQSVTQVICDLFREECLLFISDAPDASVERITWYLEVAPSLQVATRPAVRSLQYLCAPCCSSFSRIDRERVPGYNIVE